MELLLLLLLLLSSVQLRAEVVILESWQRAEEGGEVRGGHQVVTQQQGLEYSIYILFLRPLRYYSKIRSFFRHCEISRSPVDSSSIYSHTVTL